MQYARLKDGGITYAKTNYTTDEGETILNFNLDEELMLKYGYKPVIVADKPDYPYGLTYEETETEIKEIVTPDLDRAKEEKINLNDKLRDETLLGGVTYSNVLFDSDTDQKINLLATVSAMGDEDTIVWYGMDNKALLCTKADLIAIGGLITELHSYCWNMNAHIKEQIDVAETIEELDKIEVEYNYIPMIDTEIVDESNSDIKEIEDIEYGIEL